MSSAKSILFAGTRPLGAFALSALAELCDATGRQVVGVLTDTSGRKPWWADEGAPEVREVADRLGIPVIEVEQMARAGHDLLLCVYFGVIFDQATLALAPANLNLHTAPLPEFRGCNSYSLAILEGAEEYGSTLHVMSPRPDRGPIIHVDRFPLLPDDTARSLYDRTVARSAAMLTRWLPRLLDGDLDPTDQARLAVEQERPERYFDQHSLEPFEAAPGREPDEDEAHRRRRALTFPPRFAPPDWLGPLPSPRRRRLVVCGVGAGMAGSLREIESESLELTVMTDEPADVHLEGGTVIEVYPRDPAAVLAAAAEHLDGTYDGVFTLGYENPPAVAALAESLGAPTYGPEVAALCTLKDQRIAILAEAGVPVPEHEVVTSVAAGLAAARRLGLPVVVKPNDKTSSIGVRRVDSEADVEAAFAEAAGHSGTGTVVVERHLAGPQYTVEGLVYAGEVLITGCSERNYGDIAAFLPYFFENGDTLPWGLPPRQAEAVKRTVVAAVKALRLDRTAFHCDLLIPPGGVPVVLEVSGRMSGSRFGTDLVPLATGVRTLPSAVRLALGEPPVVADLVPRHERAVALRYLPSRPGIVRAVGTLSGARRMPGVHDVCWEMPLEPGTRLGPFRSGKDVIAGAIAVGVDRAEAERRANAALREVELEVEGWS
jgi:biotin carboxylase/folate-dependent phosphoribosylglycinamide formyltransferase PurN